MNATDNAKLNDRVGAELTPIDMEEYFRETLDECYPEVKTCGMTFQPSDILESCDPVAFRCGVSDAFDTDTMWESPDGTIYWRSEVEEIEAELEVDL